MDAYGRWSFFLSILAGVGMAQDDRFPSRPINLSSVPDREVLQTCHAGLAKAAEKIWDNPSYV